MLVIGNGESRIGIDINSINGTKVGCNAILRDCDVDHLVCVDRKMAREAINKKYPAQIYTRNDWWNEFKAYPNMQKVPKLPYKGDLRPDDPFHWGSGPYAVLIACLKTDHIELLGFDLHSKNKNINNVYKDTQNYNQSDHRAIDPRYWIYQIGKLISIYPQKHFKIYQEKGWNLPEAWNFPNVSLDFISNISYNT